MRQSGKSLILKAINSKETRKQIIEDFEEYELLYEKYIKEAERLYQQEIKNLSKSISDTQMSSLDIEVFDNTLMLALGSFVFSQAATLAYQKLEQALPQNPQLINDLAANFAQRRGAVLVEGINKQTQLALRETVANGLRTGASPSEVASRVRNNIGLDIRGARAVENLRNNLTSQGLSISKINKQVSQYSERLLAQRAQLIANTEMQSAIEQAKLDVYKSSGVAQIQWITDAQPCGKCAPSAGDIVPTGQPFYTTMGAYTSPPIHPNCRCQIHPVQSTP